jgi:formylglycine-generating enzyme required for sulfatase activity
MNPTTITALVSVFGPALWKVFEMLLEKGLDLALDEGVKPLKDLIASGYEEHKDANALRQMILAALDEFTDNKDVDRYDRLLATIKLTDLDKRTALALASAAIEMVQFSPAVISTDLLKLLNLDESKRDLLAGFLFALRHKLAGNTRFKDSIAYANSLEQIGQLRGLSAQMIMIVGHTRRLISLEETLVLERHLTTDEEHALIDYLAVVRRQWERVNLPLIRKNSWNISSTKLKQIFVPLILRDLCTEEHASHRMDYALLDKESKIREQEIPVGIGELLNRHERFILIGPPGCGKTTILDRIALAFAEGNADSDLGWKGKPLFPIFLRLRNFGAFLKQNKNDFPVPCSGALVAYLENQFRTGERINLTPKFFDHRLAEGSCFVLMDGLDEVSEQRCEVAQHIAAFLEQFSEKGNHFGLASRTRGYETVELQLRPLNLTVAEVNPLGLDGIYQLVGNLLTLIEPDSAICASDCDNLSQTICASKELINIAGTPLFCSALVQVYKYHGTTLPQRRVDVFDEIVDLLLGFWRAQQRQLSESEQLASEDGTGKQYREIKEAVAVKKRRLSHLAYSMQQKGQAEIDKSEAVAVLAEYLGQHEFVPEKETAKIWAENFLENSRDRSGILVERDPGIFAFLHKGFMEFLVASALVNQSKTMVKTILTHLTDEWWEQVILLVGVHPKLPDNYRTELIDEILKSVQEYPSNSEEFIRRAVMAGRLARDMAECLPCLQHKQVETILHSIANYADVFPAQRAVAAFTLDELGWLPEDLPALISIPIIASPRFWIGKYPVTNIQYGRFLDDYEFTAKKFWVDFPVFDEKGEPMEKTWGEEGYLWLLELLKDKILSPDGKRVFPREWSNPRLGISYKGLPVVGITWYEANAYCLWLKEHWINLEESCINPDFRPEFIRLPIKAEWIAATGGVEPEEYFWMDTFGSVTEKMSNILQCANLSESQIDRTTPVWMYPLGKSPLGLFDLYGNVWEWQANFIDDMCICPALRGGSWYTISKEVLLSSRSANSRSSLIGFRIVALSS